MTTRKILIAGFSACMFGCLGQNGNPGLSAPTMDDAAKVAGASSGAAVCADPAWNASTIYVQNNKVSQSGSAYTAKWWTQGEDPVVKSGPWDVWKLEGPCGDTNKAPTMVLATPLPGSRFIVGTDINFLAYPFDAEGPVAKVEFKDAAGQVVFSDASQPFEYALSGLAVGSYTYRAVAYDPQGLASVPAEVSFQVQTGVVPTVAFTAPEDGQHFYQTVAQRQPIKVTVSVNSSQTPIDSVQFRTQEYTVPGLGHSVFTTYTKKTAPFDLDYSPLGYDIGFHTIVYATAYSNGVASTQASKQFYVHPLPELTVVSPVNNSVIAGSASSIPVDVTVNSGHPPIDSVVYLVTDVKVVGDTETKTTRHFVAVAPYDLSLPVVAGNTYSLIYATAYAVSDYPERTDGQSRKQSETKTVRVNYSQGSGPVITVTAPIPVFNNSNPIYLVGGSMTVSANVTGSSPIVKVEISRFGGETVTRTAPPYTATFANLPAPAPDGSIGFNIKATDANGNTATQLIVAYKDRAPNVAITTPHTGDTFPAGSTVNIATFSTDADGVVAKVEFFNGTTKLGESTVAPFSFALVNATAGSYSLTATATDDLGVSSTTSAVTFIVGSGGGCTAPVWNTGTVYVFGNRVSRSGSEYEAKWWTKGEDPVLRSGTWDVWKKIGPCTSL